jgi:hypothetical protein
LGRLFRINSPHVVAETLDGEATIVDLESGTYHALNESGSFIWDSLVVGTQAEDVASAFASAYALEQDEATRVVDDLIRRLADQKLVVPVAESAQNGNGSAAAQTAPPNGEGTPRTYLAPKLSTYTDMQELLLLDPIHEVDESGWPSQA